jgi:hypothetical protein
MENDTSYTALVELHSMKLASYENGMLIAARIKRDLNHIEAVMALLRKEQERTPRPRSRKREIDYFMNRGRGLELALEIMRDAGEPLAMAEIVKRVAVAMELKGAGYRSLKALRVSIASALDKRLGHGLLTEIEGSGRTLWGLDG